jgi:hypothetical protein
MPRIPALWQRTLKPIDHQILWWMIDAGVPGNILLHGWMIQASKQIGIHRITLRRRIQVLVEAGILIEGKMKGSVMLNLKIFNNVADRKKIRMMKATSAMVRR